jgi:ABC-type phosphate transport system substrate-binding protein
VLNGKYPLVRFRYIYLNKKPGTPLGKVELELIKHLYSKEAQEQVEKVIICPVLQQKRWPLCSSRLT